ncbi:MULTISPECIES: hypothetical protein [unclassified Streptomyces]|uniref:hypothetical protein n=1 Tax=unclassified Streptomyces TaxID=2593676 RepID=UPI002B1D2FD0|nr:MULTISPECIES: hypothetical protein [unclassified Streptomyces]
MDGVRRLPPSVVVTLGTLAATAIDMTDPQTGLEGILPGWFTPFFLLALIVGTIAINAMTSYGSGPALQSVGVRIGRSLRVLVYGLLAVALALYALLASDFLDTVGNCLQLTVVLPAWLSTPRTSSCAATGTTAPRPHRRDPGRYVLVHRRSQLGRHHRADHLYPARPSTGRTR